MKTKRWIRGPFRTVALALAALAGVVVVAGPASAQDRDREQECRCVDRDGNEIENCRCFRTPRMVWSGFETRRARLGITLDTDPDARQATEGVRIESVMEDGPADEAGLREGDVITRLDGHSLLEPLDEEMEDDFDLDRSVPAQRLVALVRGVDAGDDVEVEYLRDGQRRTARIEADDLDDWANVRVFGPRWDAEDLAERMRDMSVRLNDGVHVLGTPRSRTFSYSLPNRSGAVLVDPDRDGLGSGGVWLFGDEGVELTQMKPGLSSYFGVDHGVLVTEVDEDSALGLEAGDVILSIHGRDVETPAQVRRILGSYRGDEPISMRVVRQQRETTVEGTLRH